MQQMLCRQYQVSCRAKLFHPTGSQSITQQHCGFWRVLVRAGQNALPSKLAVSCAAPRMQGCSLTGSKVEPANLRLCPACCLNYCAQYTNISIFALRSAHTRSLAAQRTLLCFQELSSELGVVAGQGVNMSIEWRDYCDGAGGRTHLRLGMPPGLVMA